MWEPPEPTQLYESLDSYALWCARFERDPVRAEACLQMGGNERLRLDQHWHDRFMVDPDARRRFEVLYARELRSKPERRGQ